MPRRPGIALFWLLMLLALGQACETWRVRPDAGLYAPQGAQDWGDIVDTALLDELLTDLGHYTVTKKAHHQGDLLQHSWWTAFVLNKWWREEQLWTQHLPRSYHHILLLAGLLHDVGKGGDRIFQYHHKRPHPQTGYDYLTGKKNYITKAGKELDLSQLFKNPHAHKIAALAAGMHWEFGLLGRQTHHDPNERYTLIDIYLDKLRNMANGISPTSEQDLGLAAELCIAITAADVKAKHHTPVDLPSAITKTTHLNPDTLNTVGPATQPDLFKQYGYHDFRITVRDAVYSTQSYRSTIPLTQPDPQSQAHTFQDWKKLLRSKRELQRQGLSPALYLLYPHPPAPSPIPLSTKPQTPSYYRVKHNKTLYPTQAQAQEAACKQRSPSKIQEVQIIGASHYLAGTHYQPGPGRTITPTALGEKRLHLRRQLPLDCVKPRT